jgi:hypothetical protein
VGASSPGDFDQIQTRLSTDYGPMPRPTAAGGCLLLSKKKIRHFVVQHCLSNPGEGSREQVFLYIGGGGDPRTMPKAPL